MNLLLRNGGRWLLGVRGLLFTPLLLAHTRSHLTRFDLSRWRPRPSLRSAQKHPRALNFVPASRKKGDGSNPSEYKQEEPIVQPPPPPSHHRQTISDRPFVQPPRLMYYNRAVSCLSESGVTAIRKRTSWVSNDVVGSRA